MALVRSVARIDFLWANDQIYVNEINTIPGFTTISMYAKMWEASGIGYAALVDKLIVLAVERHAATREDLRLAEEHEIVHGHDQGAPTRRWYRQARAVDHVGVDVDDRPAQPVPQLVAQ